MLPALAGVKKRERLPAAQVCLQVIIINIFEGIVLGCAALSVLNSTACRAGR